MCGGGVDVWMRLKKKKSYKLIKFKLKTKIKVYLGALKTTKTTLTN